MSLIRIAAIDFLNPAPLMWNFEHAPARERLAERYSIQKMTPAQCAARLGAGEAELGLIPIAAFASLPGLAIVPGCTIASMGAIRSILLVLRASPAETDSPGSAVVPLVPAVVSKAILTSLRTVRIVALDTASRTSAMYTRILFRKYWKGEPRFVDHPPALDAMLAAADAALLIGDPALFALKDRAAREARTGERLHYLDLGSAWREQTGVPWVSAVWAARLAGLGATPGERAPMATQIVEDLAASRDAGLANLPELTAEWSSRLGLPAATVHAYLSQNIHYQLDDACLGGIDRFYADAAECGLIQRKPEMVFL